MTAALIIAAGHTARSSGFQPMKPLGSISAVQRLILVFQRAHIDRVVLVGGEDFSRLERHVSHMGVVCLHNEEWKTSEMLDSVKQGLTYLTGKCSRTLVTPVDVPLFSVQTVEKLLGSGEKLAAPSHQGKAGHPLLLSSKLFSCVQSYTGDGGLAAATKSCGEDMRYIDVPDEGVLLDARDLDDMEAQLQAHSLSRLHPIVKVYLAREQNFFGPGPYLLLSLIGETDSLRMACGQMGISYSKGWKMVENMEKQMGQKLVNRQRGGHVRGRSELTENGRRLLEKYTAFSKECVESSGEIFKKYFGDEVEDG